MININFILVLTLILIILYFCFNIEKETFCSKKHKDRCLSRYTTTQKLLDNKAILINNYHFKKTEPQNIISNKQTEKIMSFHCFPNNDNKDCKVYSSIKDADKERENTSKGSFKNSRNYYDCGKIGKNTNGCALGFNSFGYESYKDLGFNCDLGNGKIPTKVDSNGIITCAVDKNGDCLVRKDKIECEEKLNLIPINNNNKNDASTLKCINGKIGDKCVNLYNSLKLKTLNDLGYSCNTNIEGNKLPGKIINNNNAFEFVSYDKKNIVDNCETSINFQPLNNLNNVICNNYNDVFDNKYPDACNQAFTQYNLYPSTNPFVIKGNEPDYTIKNTINNNNDLFEIYYKYQQGFPDGTNSNSAQSLSEGIEKILSETPIKLACCKRMNNNDNSIKNINVRVPVNPTIKSINPNVNKFGFQYSRINIPENSCPSNLYQNTKDCNNFYGVYCDNIINYMEQENIDVQKELINYAPECACYAPQTQGYPPTTPSVCYKNGCDITSNPNVYLDPNSRDGDSQKTCSLTICNSINDFSGITVGGNANITPQTKNQCGGFVNNENISNNQTNQTDQTEQLEPKEISNDNTKNNNQSSSTNNNILIIIIVVIIFLLLVSSSSYFLFNNKKLN